MVEGLTIKIGKALEEYTSEVEAELEKSKEKYAKVGAKTLRATSPKDTGKYAKGWRAKKVGTNWTIYNSARPELTHLLEKGHAKVGGGRVAGITHIAPVEQEVIDGYEKQLEKVIRG